jgi:hypothetical protein
MRLTKLVMVNNKSLLRLAAVLGLLIGAVCVDARAQEVKPGPEHAGFKEMEGTWDAMVKTQGGESKGTMTWKVGLNGLWLLEHFQAELGGMPFEGFGATSYDPAKKKYVNVWVDSMITSPLVTEGTFDPAKKTMIMTGKMPMPDGKMMDATFTSVHKDANTVNFTITVAGPDGKSMEMLAINYKRRAK